MSRNSFRNTRILATLAGAAGLAVSGAALAEGSSDTATANVSLEVMQAITVDATQDMDFGLAYTSQAGTGLTADTPARFFVQGADGEDYTVTLPENIEITNDDNAAATVALEVADGETTRHLNGGDGEDNFEVSGTIGSLPGETGTYSGEFTVTVSYAD